MADRFPTLLRIALIACLAFSVAKAQQPAPRERDAKKPGTEAQKPARPETPRSEKRGRRDKKDAKRQRNGEREKALRRAIELIRKLPVEKQRELLERLRSMAPEKRRETIRDAREKLNRPPEDRAIERRRRELLDRAWDQLPKQHRHRLRELGSPQERGAYFEKLFQANRERLLRKLPEDVRKKIQKLPAERRIDFIRRYRAEEAVRRTFNAQEIEKIRALSPIEVRRLFLPHAGFAGLRPMGRPGAGPPRLRPPHQRGPDARGPDRRGPREHRPDRRGPRERGPDGKSPRERGPDGMGPRERGPDARGPRTRGPAASSSTSPPQRPDFISEASWKRWLALKPYERPRVLHFIRYGDKPGPTLRPPGLPGPRRGVDGRRLSPRARQHDAEGTDRSGKHGRPDGVERSGRRGRPDAKPSRPAGPPPSDESKPSPPPPADPLPADGQRAI